MRPPVFAMSSGSRLRIIGPTSLSRSPFGAHPVGMKKAVMRPQAMKAAMFGRIIPLTKVPNFWIPTLAPPPVLVADVVVIISPILWVVMW